VVTMQAVVFLYLTPCNLVEVCLHFRRSFCLHY